MCGVHPTTYSPVYNIYRISTLYNLNKGRTDNWLSFIRNLNQSNQQNQLVNKFALVVSYFNKGGAALRNLEVHALSWPNFSIVPKYISPFGHTACCVGRSWPLLNEPQPHNNEISSVRCKIKATHLGRVAITLPPNQLMTLPWYTCVLTFTIVIHVRC